jgi:hypothetical protein
MRRAIKDKLTGILDDSQVQTLSNSEERHQMADRLVGYVREKSNSLVSTVQGYATSVTDTTGALAKQKLLQTLFSSGVIQSVHIRYALQIGVYTLFKI